MPRPTQGQPGQVLEPLLDYGCSDWVSSSQRAADLYDLGVKLWRKEDLVDIEQQLAQSLTAEKFTVRCIDGGVVHIKNPMFGVAKPIWKPYVKFQQFWSLVRVTPDGPPETYPCTYLVAWANKTTQSYDGPIENARQLFETNQKLWNTSSICETFTLQLHKLLSDDGKAKVTKIVCFGLGDLNFKPPEWWRMKNSSKPKDEQQSETSMVERAMIHHAVALTMAGVARSFAETRDMGVRLLTQDPGYSKETKDILREIGFEVVGEYGAGGFAEIDDECIVFSPFPAAPVKQVIADLARPAAIICVDKADGRVFGQPRELHLDPESPRTRQMWKEYETWGFPVSPGNVLLDASLRQLGIHVRTKE